jgi:hypothetical protein
MASYRKKVISVGEMESRTLKSRTFSSKNGKVTEMWKVEIYPALILECGHKVRLNASRRRDQSTADCDVCLRAAVEARKLRDKTNGFEGR